MFPFYSTAVLDIGDEADYWSAVKKYTKNKEQSLAAEKICSLLGPVSKQLKYYFATSIIKFFIFFYTIFYISIVVCFEWTGKISFWKLSYQIRLVMYINKFMTNSRLMRIITYAVSTIIRFIGYGYKELLF